MYPNKASVWLPWLLLLPGVAGLVIFFYLPFFNTLFTSLSSAQVSGEYALSFNNYLEVLGSHEFWNSLSFTLRFTFVAVLLDLLIGMAMALLSFSAPKKLGGLVRALIIIPWAIPQVIQASMWRWIFSSQGGPLADLLVKFGIVNTPPLFLGDPSLAFLSMVIASTWRGASISAFFLMGALTLVPKELSEAAHMDGAGWWTRLWRITLPLILPVLLVTTLFRTLDNLRVFDIIQGLTGGGPGASTTSLSYYSYMAYFRFGQFGRAATHAVLNFILVALPGIFYIAWIQNRLDQGRS